jgi:hypothetical protein
MSSSSPFLPNVAVVGCGAWGRNHVRDFHGMGALHAVADADPAVRRAVADGQSGVRVLEVLAAAGRSIRAEGRAGKLHEQAPDSFVHETAAVDAGAQVGCGTRIWHGAHVMGSARVGRDCVLGQNVFVGPRVTVGDRTKIQNNVSLYEGVELGEDVFCGLSAVFTNVRHPRAHVERKCARCGERYRVTGGVVIRETLE